MESLLFLQHARKLAKCEFKRQSPGINPLYVMCVPQLRVSLRQTFLLGASRSTAITEGSVSLRERSDVTGPHAEERERDARGGEREMLRGEREMMMLRESH